MRARSPTASSTVLSKSSFSSSVVVGDSPVVPGITRPSHPPSPRWLASRATVSVSSEPSGPNGVTIAVSRVPRRAGASNPTVVTVFRLPGGGKLFSTRAQLKPPLGLGGQRTGGDFGPVGQSRHFEVSEDGGCDGDELTQALDGQTADFDIGMLAGPHGDEVSPCPVVAGHHNAGLGGIGQHCPCGL